MSTLDLKKLLLKLTQYCMVGEIKAYAGSTIPTGWHLCDGSEVAISDYPKLYSVIGDTYNNDDAWAEPVAEGNFRLPDLSGRTLIGESYIGGSGEHFVGDYGGEETHKLTTTEMPSHSHHASATFVRYINKTSGLAKGSNGYKFFSDESNLYTDAAGGNGAHNNMQPYLVVNFIIYMGGVVRKIFRLLLPLPRKVVIV